MVRIEKTQINNSAFIVLCSTLKKIKSDNVIDILDEGKSVIYRKKEESEKENFEIDLEFLDVLFKALVTGDPGPVIVTGDDEKYLKNCSYACYYYRYENIEPSDYDHFSLFHKIHFSSQNILDNEKYFFRLLCGLFLVDFKLCLPFTNCENNIIKDIDLPEKHGFNQIFKTLKYRIETSREVLILESYPLTMMESLDSLFAIKDLLSCSKIDTSIIPEYNWFSIQRNEEVKFTFELFANYSLLISFRYDRLLLSINKNCA